MDRILARLPFIKCYIDDTMVFKHLVEHGLKLHPSKCTFFYSQVKYLEHMIYPRGLGVLKGKVEALASIPRAKDVS